MKVQDQKHLPEKQILWAVIDEKELSGEEQQHLAGCPLCRNKVGQFKEELQLFGQKANQAVPPFSKPVKLPDEKPVNVSHNAGWLPFFGAAAMVSFVVFFYFMGMKTMPTTNLATLQNQESLLEDESLMREISEMVEYPLPESLYELTGDSEVGFEEDFLQFVVPDIQNDFQSEIINQGGVKQC
jgi:hypothetical protein